MLPFRVHDTLTCSKLQSFLIHAPSSAVPTSWQQSSFLSLLHQSECDTSPTDSSMRPGPSRATLSILPTPLPDAISGSSRPWASRHRCALRTRTLHPILTPSQHVSNYIPGRKSAADYLALTEIRGSSCGHDLPLYIYISTRQYVRQPRKEHERTTHVSSPLEQDCLLSWTGAISERAHSLSGLVVEAGQHLVEIFDLELGEEPFSNVIGRLAMQHVSDSQGERRRQMRAGVLHPVGSGR